MTTAILDQCCLNAAWLKKHFVIEPIDEQVLRDPEQSVLAQGGAIFFARLGDVIIGLCALLHEAPGVYELSKMGVDGSVPGPWRRSPAAGCSDRRISSASRSYLVPRVQQQPETRAAHNRPASCCSRRYAPARTMRVPTCT
jgi:hypothetical protein